jgi:glycosyltransferase involved in cell wall biosynthesis
MPPSSTRPLKLSLIHRRPIEGFYSIEGYFKRISQSLRSLGVEVTNHTSPYASQGLLQRLKIVRFANRHQGEITHISGDIHFAALGTDPGRTVVTVHDCGRLHQLRGLPREIMRQFWFQLPLRRVAAVTVISQAAKDDLLTWVPDLDPERIQIVPVSISAAFRFSAKPFASQNPRILQVGTAPNKNIVRLAAALEGMAATLVVIGKLSPELEAVLARHRIRVENHRDISEQQVVELYRGADLLAFVSTLEGFGMPILEAQTVGRPVLTSNCSSMPEVAGGAALLVDPLCVQSIRAGLQRLIDDAPFREELVARGQENVRRFSSDAIAAQYLEIYRSLRR